MGENRLVKQKLKGGCDFIGVVFSSSGNNSSGSSSSGSSSSGGGSSSGDSSGSGPGNGTVEFNFPVDTV